MMKNPYKLAAFVAGYILMTLFAFESFWAFWSIEKSIESRKKTLTLFDSTNAILTAFIDFETDQQDFSLINGKLYQQRYSKLRTLIIGQYEELGDLIINSKGRKASSNLKKLKALLLNNSEYVSYNGHLVYIEDPASAQMISKQGQIISLMNSIRTEINNFIWLEKLILVQSDDEFQLNMRKLLFMLSTTCFLSLLLSFILAFLYFRNKHLKIRTVFDNETSFLLENQRELNSNLRKLNNDLEISEEKLAVTINSIGDAVLATDIKGKVTLLNSVAEKLSGWSFAEAAGRKVEEIFNIINEETRKPSIIPVNDTLIQGKIMVLAKHTILIARDGTECAIADSCAPIHSRDGKVIGAVLIFRDVTERNMIERGLREALKELESSRKIEHEAREYSESIINTIREPLITLNQNLMVVSVSRSFCDYFKIKKEQAVGKRIFDLGNKQWDIPSLRELLETILQQETSFDNFAVKLDFQSIGIRIILLNARLIKRESGLERLILLAFEDITERKNSEYVLEKAHEELNLLAIELQHTTNTKSEFLANMSHELRTPLNSIIGFSEVLIDEIFGTLNEKQKRYVNNVLVSGKHLLALINQILDTAKVESGKMKLLITTLPIKILLREISMLISDMVSKKFIHMQLELSDDLPDIDGDELKIKEIIYNLLSNAVKFTPEGGEIGMKARRLNSMIEIVVWDSGIGISQDNIEKIFEGFFRVDTPYSRITEGTGLGLPLSRKLVELHNGNLIISSDGLNTGTTVTFTLPINSVTEQAS